MRDENLSRREYCEECDELVTADEGSFSFYCDCGNEWIGDEE